MFHSELITTTTLNPKFHTFVEQITGLNSASVVQNGKKLNSDQALILAYFKAFSDPKATDTDNIKHLRSMLYFSMLCVGDDLDMSDVTCVPHGLRCLRTNSSVRRGLDAVIFSGDGEQWYSAIKNAGGCSCSALQDWGLSCHNQFALHGLDDVLGRIRPTNGTQYFLENK